MAIPSIIHIGHSGLTAAKAGISAAVGADAEARALTAWFEGSEAVVDLTAADGGDFAFFDRERELAVLEGQRFLSEQLAPPPFEGRDVGIIELRELLKVFGTGEQLRRDMISLADTLDASHNDPQESPAVRKAIVVLFQNYFGE